MGVYDSRARVAKGLKELMMLWAETARTWNDSMSKAFHKKHLEPLESDLKAAAGAMDNMAQLLAQAKRDCS